MPTYTFENGLKADEIVDFAQSDYLAKGENGLCILLSGAIATNITREMNRGRCNLGYIEFWLKRRMNEASYRLMFNYARANQGQGKGVTSSRCQERPVHGSLSGYGEVLGVYFDLKHNAHACCLIPDSSGQVALFFDPNYGLLKISKTGSNALTTTDIADVVEGLYENQTADNLNLKIGRYQSDAGFRFT